MKIENNRKIILDLCGGTGAWSKPYKDAGCQVFNITLPDFDVRKYEVQENYIKFININNLNNSPIIYIPDMSSLEFLKSRIGNLGD